MGTIASVLQWTCSNCNHINPIELIRCPKCDNVRLLSDSTLIEEEDEGPLSASNESKGGPDACNHQQSSISDTSSQSSCGQRGAPVTGYLEIKTDG